MVQDRQNPNQFMAEGYCVKCKAKKPISDAVEEIMKNGRKAIKGRCPTCGTVMFKILGGKAAVAPAPAPSSTQPVPPAEKGVQPAAPLPAPAPTPVAVPNAPVKESAEPKPQSQPAGEKKSSN
jgi:hypothetical protein